MPAVQICTFGSAECHISGNTSSQKREKIQNNDSPLGGQMSL